MHTNAKINDKESWYIKRMDVYVAKTFDVDSVIDRGGTAVMVVLENTEIFSNSQLLHII